VSGAYYPLSYKQVVWVLKKLGFEQRPNKATSHEQWVAQNPFRKVTVDKHEQPFGMDLVSSMARQAGVSKKEFYQLLG
jgi:predicted RNA binding protein YcfA (HicA-like mRNA interferase family)